MAFTQGAIGTIKSFVQKAKSLLMTEFENQLQQYYGIRPDGSCTLVEELTSTSGSVIQTAQLLRERLDYLKESIPGNNKDKEAVAQLKREQAFTILNRFAALRMAEERGIVRESVRKGYQSEGFQVFDQITGGAQSADQFTRYTGYLNAVFDELALDLPSVFDRFSPYALLFPSEKALSELLDILNQESLSHFREPGYQPINLWKEDETIGWIYQYYNSREEISAMREASGAPRNSRELAVRNQFFTPRYVVQFLVDNSLGRQWYEMNQGNTELAQQCAYLVKHEQEIFLRKGEDLPDTKIEGVHHVEHRPLKDPRQILMLDPACGSMHFGLYCFDLFEKIYTEAWDKHVELMSDLRDRYSREEFIRQIPEMIIRHNIHGVDIDPRAIQIAGLSLWLRAQKSYADLGLEPKDRPSISKSNLVVAEPMPGDQGLLSEFTQNLPGPIGKLVRVIWDKMKLAGETGLLLKIEQELKKEIEIAKKEWEEYKNTSSQTTLFDASEESEQAKMAAIYGKGQKISKDFFDKAEEHVLRALKSFSENAEGDHAFQKLLFAEDTARGFAFIELCRKKYDVIVMNPPFGAAAKKTKKYIDQNYITSKSDLAAVFIDRMLDLNFASGLMGVLSTRTIYFIRSFERWRKGIVDNHNFTFADFGLGVLDAQVEASAVLYNEKHYKKNSTFFRIYSEKKDLDLLNEIKGDSGNTFCFNLEKAVTIPNAPFCYWLNESLLEFFSKSSYKVSQGGVKQGLATADNFRYIRNHFEVYSGNWERSLVEGGSTRFYAPFDTMVLWYSNGKEIKNFIGTNGKLRSVIRNEVNYFSKGISFPKRSSHFKPHIVPEGCIFSNGRFLAIGDSKENLLHTLAIWNSTLFDYLLKLSVGNIGGVQFENGLVEKFPFISFEGNVRYELVDLTTSQYNLMRSCFNWSPTNIDFEDNFILKDDSLKKSYDSLEQRVELSSRILRENQVRLNEIVFNFLDINKATREELTEEIDVEKIVIERDTFYSEVIDLLLGSVFGRWDLRLLKYWQKDWCNPGLFRYRKHSPFLYGPRESTLDLVLPEYQNEIIEIWQIPYPIKTLEECATVSKINSIVDKLKEVIIYLWKENYITIEEELVDHFKVNVLSEIFDKHSKFFNAHLKDYSRNKRISPIYWHLGVPSGKFNVWVYYPRINENSLYKIVNDLVEPKIAEIKNDISALEVSGSTKELNDQRSLIEELQDFKTELLRVAQLPYKPNQDDGVLITAAPLHNLFQHSKWRKSTEACWKKLQKGEYDWAQMAHAIWPDRVREKCKKDLSMAIAHRLEDICEIKPKKTKTRTKKGISKKSQSNLL